MSWAGASIDHSLYSFDPSLHALLLFDLDYVVACHLRNYFVFIVYLLEDE